MRYTSVKIAAFFLLAWLIQSCRKDVPQGQAITASGFVIDMAQQKRLPSATIYLFGGHDHYGPGGLEVLYDTIPLDSTSSDANGNFSITYFAEGQSDDYALSLTKNIFHPGNTESYLPDANQPLYKFNHAYNLKDVAISAKELMHATVALQVTSNPYDTLLFRILSAPS